MEKRVGEPQRGALAGSSGTEVLRWRSLDEAAVLMSMTVRKLRRALAERAHTAGAQKEVYFDGLVARKLGRRWKVWFTAEWMAPAPVAARAMLASAENAGHGRKEVPHGRA